MEYSLEEEAKYCLNCKNKPCTLKGCPLNNNIPKFIEKIKENNIDEAFEVLSQTSVLSAICGKVCPHKKQCEGSCIRGIKGNSVEIGKLEEFVGKYGIKNNLKINKNINKKIENKKVAIIGAGPAGLTCAAFLARYGIKVTIFERYNFLGGLLMYGIPDFRLSKDIVKKTINKILDLGIEVKYNKELGKNLELEDLLKNYDRIFIAIGANRSSKMGVDGENLEGVYGANELLELKNHPNYIGKIVIVNGGGDVAIDVARTIKRLGAKAVKIVYRREEEQMPAEEKEINSAKKEGIEIHFKNNIVKILGDKKVEAVELIKTELVKKEGDKRLFPINIDESNYKIKADYVIMALGSKTDEVVQNLGLDLDNKNNIVVNENYQTSNPKIYAGGDLIGKMKTIAWAARYGRETAESIIRELELKC